MQKNMHKQVTVEWHLGRLVAVGILLTAGLIFSLVLLKSSQENRSRAQLENVKSQTLPSPTIKVDLPTPYIRLVSKKQNYNYGDNIILGLNLNTGGTDVSALDIVVKYDRELLDLDENSLTNTGIFRSINKNLTDSGDLIISLFVTPESGYGPVNAGNDTEVVQINFKPKVFSPIQTDIDILFQPENTSKSFLMPYYEERPVKPENILKGVKGITLSIGS